MKSFLFLSAKTHTFSSRGTKAAAAPDTFIINSCIFVKTGNNRWGELIRSSLKWCLQVFNRTEQDYYSFIFTTASTAITRVFFGCLIFKKADDLKWYNFEFHIDGNKGAWITRYKNSFCFSYRATMSSAWQWLLGFIEPWSWQATSSTWSLAAKLGSKTQGESFFMIAHRSPRKNSIHLQSYLETYWS